MNEYINAQILQMKAYAQNWEIACKMAALKRDGIMDKDEEKQLKRIKKAVQVFITQLDKATQ